MEDAVSTINLQVHRVKTFAPRKLWAEDEDKLQLPHQILERERTYKNVKREIHLNYFYSSQIVLILNERLSITRFQSRWKGPYYLTDQVSCTVWVARPEQTTGRGRQQILRFYVDQMQPFFIE